MLALVGDQETHDVFDGVDDLLAVVLGALGVGLDASFQAHEQLQVASEGRSRRDQRPRHDTTSP